MPSNAGVDNPFRTTDRFNRGIMLRTSSNVFLVLLETRLSKHHKSVSKIEKKLLERIVCAFKGNVKKVFFFGVFFAANIYCLL